MLRRVALAVLALIATAETLPPVPAALRRYVTDGRFEPGDFGWLRGSFAGATSAQRMDWTALLAWREDCGGKSSIDTRGALAARGVTVQATGRAMGEGLCGDVAYSFPRGDRGNSWLAFQAAVTRARPIAQTILWSAAIAQQVADPDKPDAASLLIARPVTDQVLRNALSWDRGDIAGAPALDTLAQGVAEGLIWHAIAARDHANTVWLKTVVAKDGWPTISKMGEQAAHAAWLLVQHADDDPVFQFDMLRLMEPLVARDEVAKQDFAFLYDRVMLKITGAQRYASQMTCRGGVFVPLPLEDAARADALRRQMGMGTIAQNTARITKAYGACPPDPAGATAPKGS